MGFNYRKSINLGKGVRINYSKNGPSLSFGKTGMRVNLNTKGRVRGTVGIPGSGMYYQKEINLLDKIKGLFGLGNNEASAKEEAQAQEGNMAGEGFDPEGSTQGSQGNAEEVAQQYIDYITGVHRTMDVAVPWEEWAGKPMGQDAKSDELIQLAQGVLAGKEDSYLEAVNTIRPFQDLTELGSDFEVGLTESGDFAVTFQVNSEKIVPKQEPKILKSGKVSMKDLSVSRRGEIERDYVASTALRVGSDLMVLLPIQEVLVLAVEKGVDEATGHETEIPLLKLTLDKPTLESLNLAQTQAYPALSNFKYEMNYKKTKGLEPIK